MSLLPNEAQGRALALSARTIRGRHALAELRAWLDAQRNAQHMRTRRVPLAELRGWRFTPAPRRLAHESGRFFAVEGLRVETDLDGERAWDQPIVDQPEAGILGFVVREFEGVIHLLAQAKVEPGNVNGVQITTTVQATRSNFTRAHGGLSPPHLEHFLPGASSRPWLDVLQAEQGSRFFRKCNHNRIVEIEQDLEDGERFVWMTIGQLKELLLEDNTVTMDARTVLACIARWTSGRGEEGQDEIGGLAAEAWRADRPGTAATRHALRDQEAWLGATRRGMRYAVRRCGLEALRDWRIGEWAIEHREGRHFSVVGCEVETDSREVARWCQPLIAHPGMGLNGMLVQNLDGVEHLLMRLHAYPGDRVPFEFSSTVSCSDVAGRLAGSGAPPYLEFFAAPPAEWIRYSGIQSEEGGRFHHYQNRYVILEVPEGLELPESPLHRWMSHAQVHAWLARSLVGIEARNLLACLPVRKACAAG